MRTEKDKKAEILFRAGKLMYYNELLIRQCDSWLSEEEGNKNMMRAIMERNKTKIASGFKRFKDHQSKHKI